MHAFIYRVRLILNYWVLWPDIDFPRNKSQLISWLLQRSVFCEWSENLTVSAQNISGLKISKNDNTGQKNHGQLLMAVFLSCYGV